MSNGWEAEGKIGWSRTAETTDSVKFNNISGRLQALWPGEAGHSDLGTMGGREDGGRRHGVQVLEPGRKSGRHKG
jgi:hypothetical protein